MPSEGAIENFRETIDRTYGAYLDAQMGFYLVVEKITDVQKRIGPRLNLTAEELDRRPMTFGDGDPDDSSTRRLHEVPQGEFKYRNRKHGENSLFMGSLCVVAIYQFWEDRFRNEIAAELGVRRDELKNDLFGDIRLLRIAIVHHGGVARREIEKCGRLKWFKPGEEISIDEEKMKEIVFAIKAVCEEWKKARAAAKSKA